MMKGSLAVALATGTLVVVAYGGFAMAVEAEDPSDPAAAITMTAEPDEASGEDADDAPSPDAPDDENGLVCVLVPVEEVPVEGESAEGESAEGEPVDGETPEAEPSDDEPEPVTIEQVLEVDAIECSGTGNDRSSEVALVPRYLAHSDEFTGAEKGAAIAEWAKTHANKKKSDDDEGTVDDGESVSGDAATPTTDDSGSHGRSGDAPGRSGSQPGNGNGR
jgi:hypothetical protein